MTIENKSVSSLSASLPEAALSPGTGTGTGTATPPATPQPSLRTRLSRRFTLFKQSSASNLPAAALADGTTLEEQMQKVYAVAKSEGDDPQKVFHFLAAMRKSPHHWMSHIVEAQLNNKGVTEATFNALVDFSHVYEEWIIDISSPEPNPLPEYPLENIHAFYTAFLAIPKPPFEASESLDLLLSIIKKSSKEHAQLAIEGLASFWRSEYSDEIYEEALSLAKKYDDPNYAGLVEAASKVTWVSFDLKFGSEPKEYLKICAPATLTFSELKTLIPIMAEKWKQNAPIETNVQIDSKNLGFHVNNKGADHVLPVTQTLGSAIDVITKSQITLQGLNFKVTSLQTAAPRLSATEIKAEKGPPLSTSQRAAAKRPKDLATNLQRFALNTTPIKSGVDGSGALTNFTETESGYNNS